MEEGIVLKTTGQVYEVLTKTGERVSCTLKGNLRMKSISTTNPAVVGDTVTIDETSPGEYVITAVAPRKNYIIRQSKKLSKQFQIIASNIDQVFVFVTITHPKTQNTFIDRILITAEAYQIEAHLIFNKTDLYTEKNKADAAERVDTYTNIGYPCHSLSLLDDKQVASLKNLFTNKTSLLCGLSGTGKSTLINYLVPGINRKTGDISKAHKKGMHLTTFSEMIPLYPNDGALITEMNRINTDINKIIINPKQSAPSAFHTPSGFVIDTPGIQEFGLADINKYELSQYFREMNLYRDKCKFNSCMHTNEPGCAVMQAVDEGKIAISRYESYLSMLLNEGEEEVRYE